MSIPSKNSDLISNSYSVGRNFPNLFADALAGCQVTALPRFCKNLIINLKNELNCITQLILYRQNIDTDFDYKIYHPSLATVGTSNVYIL